MLARRENELKVLEQIHESKKQPKMTRKEETEHRREMKEVQRKERELKKAA